MEADDPDDLSTISAEYFILVPFSNPLQNSDPNTWVWYSASQLSYLGIDYIADISGMSNSIPGRVIQVAALGYLNYAAAYYSHEIAHQIVNIRKNQHFWVDMSDWEDLVPEFIFNSRLDCYGVDSYEEYARVINTEDGNTLRMQAIAAGLCQNELLARFAANNSEIRSSQNPCRSAIFITNHIHSLLYTATWNTKETTEVTWQTPLKPGKGSVGDPDAYIETMNKAGVCISREDWTIASALTFFLSGQTVQSGYSIYKYLSDGSDRTDIVKYDILGDAFIGLPNFYLFPTVRGLYLESETYIGNATSEGSGILFNLGTGLDSFGASRTGPVDRIRIGMKYTTLCFRNRYLNMNFSPRLYFDMTRDMHFKGHSVGVDADYIIKGPISLFVRLEHNHDDMIEQYVKLKGNGINVLIAAKMSW